MGENVWADVNRAFEVLHAQSHENMNTLGTGKETSQHRCRSSTVEQRPDSGDVLKARRPPI